MERKPGQPILPLPPLLPRPRYTRMTSAYLDKIKEAHETLAIINNQLEPGKVPVSAKENLRIALGYLKSQIETIERLIE